MTKSGGISSRLQGSGGTSAVGPTARHFQSTSDADLNSLVTVGEVNTNRASEILAGAGGNGALGDEASGEEHSPYGVPITQQ